MDYTSLFAAAFVTLTVALFCLRFTLAFCAALCKGGEEQVSSIIALLALLSFSAGIYFTNTFCWKLAHVVYAGWAA